MLSMPFNTTDIQGLYCVGDSTFPGQVSGRGSATAPPSGMHSATLKLLNNHPAPRPAAPPPSLAVPQGVNAVVFSGFGAAHRVAVDIGLEPGWPLVDRAYRGLLSYARDRS